MHMFLLVATAAMFDGSAPSGIRTIQEAILSLNARSAATPVPTANGPVPIGSPGAWISPDDYPKSALRKGAEGNTGFQLLVDPSGKPVDCLVVKTSGDDGLDAATCALLRDRAHFRPARDTRGRAVSGRYNNMVRWQIPRAPFPLKPFAAEMAFDVSAAGAPSGCQTTGDAMAEVALGQMCGEVIAKAAFAPFLDAQGKPQPKRVTLHVSVEVTDPSPQVTPPPPGKQLGLN